MKSYDQYCAVARALDTVGDRWVLLVVRELLAFGPSRYIDIKRGLPGIASNMLVERLKTMESDGLIERRTAPAPVAAQVYELTERGRALEGVLRALTLWGLSAMPAGPTSSDAVQPQWTALFAGLTLPDKLPARKEIVVGVRTGEESVRVTLGPAGYAIERGQHGHVDVMLSGSADLVGGLLSGVLTRSEAQRLGLEIEGRADVVTILTKAARSSTGARA